MSTFEENDSLMFGNMGRFDEDDGGRKKPVDDKDENVEEEERRERKKKQKKQTPQCSGKMKSEMHVTTAERKDAAETKSALLRHGTILTVNISY